MVLRNDEVQSLANFFGKQGEKISRKIKIIENRVQPFLKSETNNFLVGYTY